MAEYIVKKLLRELADVAITELRKEFQLVIGVEAEVQNLSSKLELIRKMLRDALEKGRLKKDDAVGTWLGKLEDVAYDADDVLEEWSTQVQKLKVEADDDEDPNSPNSQQLNKVCSFFLSICSFFKQVPVRHDIAHKIKELNGRMNEVFQRADDFKFNPTNLNSTSGEFKHDMTTSTFDGLEDYGRESDKDILLKMILPDSTSYNTDDGIRIVSVVGTGGIGKTTLAQLVFNDNQVKKEFESFRKWVCVSDPFDQKRIAKAILEDPNQSSPDLVSFELETLLQRIKTLISGTENNPETKKKFLIVLDDFWAEEDSMWKPIWNSLQGGASGSRILVTTRKEEVKRMLGTDYVHQLEPLADSDCWKILSQIAFQKRPKDFDPEMFSGIGIEVSKKCKGLPLAATFLGCLLRKKDTVQQWKNVFNSEIWEMEGVTNNLFRHIYLSYNELSPEMKRCFLYCAVFPKDSEIKVKELIKQWMAQGYLMSFTRESRAAADDLESRGYNYLSDLAMCSFFQNLKKDKDNGEITSCKMHDIVHDFAQLLTNGECLIIDEIKLNKAKKELEAKKELSSCERVRHLTWSHIGGEEGGDDVAIVNSMVSNNVGNLRSFFYRSHGWNNNSSDVAFRIIGCLKSVRTLSLPYIYLEEVPKAIGNLIHLRFLDLSGWDKLKILPEEICELYNLEILNVSYCGQLTQFPERIGNLRKLRHLVNWGTEKVQQFPRGLEKLTSLKTLNVFKVGKSYSKLEYLKNLNQLGGDHLWIDFYNEVNEDEAQIDFESAKLGDKIHLVSLTLCFGSGGKHDVQAAVAGPPNLERLRIVGYPNSKLPSWITSLYNMREVEISGGNFTSLPAFGELPLLENLALKNMKGIKYLGREFLGITFSFPKLKKLVFSDLVDLEKWEDLREEKDGQSMIMPCLEVLDLCSCKKLRVLPNWVRGKAKSLKDLRIVDCPALWEHYEDLISDRDSVINRLFSKGSHSSFGWDPETSSYSSFGWSARSGPMHPFSEGSHSFFGSSSSVSWGRVTGRQDALVPSRRSKKSPFSPSF